MSGFVGKRFLVLLEGEKGVLKGNVTTKPSAEKT